MKNIEKGLCESCGAMPAQITTGPFADSYGMHDYCVHCSKDLCDDCFKKACRESPTGKHEKETSE